MILVTGGTGLVGSHLLQQLVGRKKAVRAIYRAGSDRRFLGGAVDSIEWVGADLLEPQSLYEAMQGIEEVYHCAALVSYSPADVELLQQANVQGTANVVNMALEAGVRKLLHVSSIAALGRKGVLPIMTESSSWGNGAGVTHYAKSKMLAEREVWRGIEEGLEAVIVNPSVVLGRGDWRHGSPRLIQRVADGLRFYPSGGTGFVDVLDVVEVMQLLMERPISNERFILNAANLSYQEFFGMVASELGVSAPVWRAAPILGELAWRLEAVRSRLTGKKALLTRETARQAQKRSYYSSQKVADLLGYEFRPVQLSIKRVCQEFLADSRVV